MPIAIGGGAAAPWSRSRWLGTVILVLLEAILNAALLNKQIAAALGVGEKMVKVHRGRVMEKMRAGSLAELVRLADQGGVIATRP